MASTYTPIATQTLGSATNLVTFSSIPSTYTDFIFVISCATATLQDMYFRINGDSGTNYSWTHLYGTGSAAGSTKLANNASAMADYYGAPNLTLGTSNQIIQFMNYSNTNIYKTILTRSNRADSGTDLTVNLWRSTTAINSVEFRMAPAASYNFSAGSTFTIYGITAA